MKHFLRNALALAAILLSGGAVQASAQQTVTETYDFATWAKEHVTAGQSGTTNLATSGVFRVNRQNVTPIQSFTGTDGTVWDINGRIAVQESKIAPRNDKKGNGSLYSSASGGRTISIMNLDEGDKVVVTGTGTTFTSTNATFQDNGTATQVTSGLALTSGTEYTITTAGRLDLNMARYNNWYKLEIIRTVTADEVSSPSIAVTGANGTLRTVTITPGKSTLGNAVKTYYTTDGTDPTTASAEYTTPITVSSTTTVKAISVAGDVKSDIESLKVEAGTELQLVAPVPSFTKMTENGGLYHPTYTFVSDNRNVLGAPTATLSATLDGEAVELADGSFTFTKAGTLKVTASAEGYGSTSTDITVSDVDYAKTYSFDASQFTYAANAKEAATQNTLNGTGCRYYNLSDCTYSLDSRINIVQNITFAWAITANKGYGLTSRLGKGEISFTLDDDQLIEFSGSNVVSKGSDKSITFPQYSYISAINVYSPASTPLAVTINPTTSLSSFSSTSAVTVPEGVYVYKAAAPADNVIKVTKVDTKVIPANTGVLLYKNGGGDVNLTYGGTADADFSDNKLVATTTAITGDGKSQYVLDPAAQQFLLLAEGGTLAAGKAYVEAPANGAKLNIVFDGAVTAIKNIESVKTADAENAYNLAGQRVGKDYKGVVIVNGKKVVRK